MWIKPALYQEVSAAIRLGQRLRIGVERVVRAPGYKTGHALRIGKLRNRPADAAFRVAWQVEHADIGACGQRFVHHRRAIGRDPRRAALIELGG